MQELSKEEQAQLGSLLYSLAFKDEFKRTKVKIKALDEFLEQAKKGEIDTPEEFIEEGLKKTLPPTLLSLISEKLKRYVKKNKENRYGQAAMVVLSLLYNNVSLHENPFLIGIFVRSAKERSLSDNNKVWNLLYQFLPKKVQEGESEFMKKPEGSKDLEKDYDKVDSGLLIPKKKGKKKGKSSQIILPGED